MVVVLNTSIDSLAEIQVAQPGEPSERRGHLRQRVVVHGQLSQRSHATDRRRHRSQPIAVEFQTGQRRESPERGRGYRRQQVPRCRGRGFDFRKAWIVRTKFNSPPFF